MQVVNKVWFILNNAVSAAHNALSDICVELCVQIITMLCNCAGIVRGVDVQKGLLYLITPVPLQQLQSVDLLQQGLIEIPTTLLQVTCFPPILAIGCSCKETTSIYCSYKPPQPQPDNLQRAGC